MIPIAPRAQPRGCHPRHVPRALLCAIRPSALWALGAGLLSWFVLSLAIFVGFESVAKANMVLALQFNGQPFAPIAAPEIGCFSHDQDRWVACDSRPAAQPGEYWIATLPEGRYAIHVSIDENPANPRRFPGDYEAQKNVDVVTASAEQRVEVDMPRLIHLMQPGDNARPLDGMLTGCATQPQFTTERYAVSARAKIDLQWEPVTDGAAYHYSLVVMPCDGSSPPRQVVDAQTSQTRVALELPPLADNENYAFRVEAWAGGKMIGDLYTHDSGVHSWNYRFRVLDNTVPYWAYFLGATLLLLAMLALWKVFGGLPSETRARRLRVVVRGGLLLLILEAVFGIGYKLRQEQQREVVQSAAATIQAERSASANTFLSAFGIIAPKPEWWDAVDTPYRVHSYGDLMAAWQGYPRDDAHRELAERQFFKAAYQGILDHSDDPHIVATAIELLGYVVADYPRRTELAEYGINRYFDHQQRTDNCANCMRGDTVQALALNLSQLYASAKRYDDAIRIAERLITERGDDVSPYKLAETWNQLAWIYWHKGEQRRAVEVAREAIGKYGHTVSGDALARTLQRFEQDLAAGS